MFADNVETLGDLERTQILDCFRISEVVNFEVGVFS